MLYDDRQDSLAAAMILDKIVLHFLYKLSWRSSDDVWKICIQVNEILVKFTIFLLKQRNFFFESQHSRKTTIIIIIKKKISSSLVHEDWSFSLAFSFFFFIFSQFSIVFHKVKNNFRENFSRNSVLNFKSQRIHLSIKLCEIERRKKLNFLILNQEKIESKITKQFQLN
jgi:hypothetical protein